MWIKTAVEEGEGGENNYGTIWVVVPRLRSQASRMYQELVQGERSGAEKGARSLDSLRGRQALGDGSEVKHGTKKSTTSNTLINHFDSDERPGYQGRYIIVPGKWAGSPVMC